MAPGSPRVTRARAKERAKARRNNDSGDHNRSGSQHSESDSDSADDDFSHTHSRSSPDSSSASVSHSRVYPDLSKELNESEDLTESLEDQVDFCSRPRAGKGGKTSPKGKGQKSPGKNFKSPEKEKSEQTTGNSNSILLIVGVVLIVIAAVVYVVFMPDSSSALGNVSNDSESESGFKIFEKDVKVLQSSFLSQTKRFWNTVSASARHVYYQQDPCYPSVILMASHNKNQRLNACLAKKIAYTFSVSRGVNSGDSDVGSDIEDIKHLDPEQQKIELDDRLSLAFQKRGEKAFVISNVQHLAPKAALLLHGFCDGDNAPYKDVMILLSFQVDDSVVFKSVKDVENYLVKIWSKGLDMDKLSAVMSRIANNPVVVQPEAESVVSKMCS